MDKFILMQGLSEFGLVITYNLIEFLDFLRKFGNLSRGVVSQLCEASLELLKLLLIGFALGLKLTNLLFVYVDLLGSLGLESLDYLDFGLFRLSLYSLIFLTELVELLYQSLNLLLHL
jgi:hypothetical protein